MLMENTQGVILIIVIGFVILGAFVLTGSRRSHYSDSHPLLDKIRENFAKLDPKYAKIPLKKGNSAYTENKETITICLKDPKTGEYYDINTLMYVALHELGHIISKTHGHNEEFRENFAMILRKAAKIGIYDPRKPIPQSYCGVESNN